MNKHISEELRIALVSLLDWTNKNGDIDASMICDDVLKGCTEWQLELRQLRETYDLPD